MKIYICITLGLILAITMQAQAQIKLRSIEKQSVSSQRVLVDDSSGSILKDEAKKNGDKNILTNGMFVGIIPADEEILHFSNQQFYSAKNTLGKINLKKYSIVNGAMAFQNSLDLQESQIAFFDNGSFVVLDASEEGGRHIKIYSSDFQLIKDYIPFNGGYDRSLFNIYKDEIVIATTPSHDQFPTQIVIINTKGEIIFNKDLNEEGDISSVLISKNYVAVYSFNIKKREHKIFIYNKKGILLWESSIDSMIQKWGFFESSTPSLIIGTGSYLFVLNATNGSLTERKKLTEIYDDSNTKRLRLDNYIKVVDIKPIFDNESIGVLLVEPTGLTNFKNIILYSFGALPISKRQSIKLGDSTILPSMQNSTNELLIIKDKEILRYGL